MYMYVCIAHYSKEVKLYRKITQPCTQNNKYMSCTCTCMCTVVMNLLLHSLIAEYLGLHCVALPVSSGELLMELGHLIVVLH